MLIEKFNTLSVESSIITPILILHNVAISFLLPPLDGVLMSLDALTALNSSLLKNIHDTTLP